MTRGSLFTVIDPVKILTGAGTQLDGWEEESEGGECPKWGSELDSREFTWVTKGQLGTIPQLTKSSIIVIIMELIILLHREAS